jgi:hypothetical protein
MKSYERTNKTRTLVALLSHSSNIRVYKRGNVRDIVSHANNHSCTEHKTIRSLSVVELRVHVTVECIKILSVAQQCFYGQFMSPAKIKCTRARCCSETKEFSFAHCLLRSTIW